MEVSDMNTNGNGYLENKKKRLTSNQIDFLERCFQEDMKLDSERKMNLSRELGLQPRQITVWFQNRRTRLKTKQLEHSYDVLKQENQKLRKEVTKARVFHTSLMYLLHNAHLINLLLLNRLWS